MSVHICHHCKICMRNIVQGLVILCQPICARFLAWAYQAFRFGRCRDFEEICFGRIRCRESTACAGCDRRYACILKSQEPPPTRAKIEVVAAAVAYLCICCADFDMLKRRLRARRAKAYLVFQTVFMGNPGLVSISYHYDVQPKQVRDHSILIHGW